jgi:hypothetical protein
MTEIIGKPIFLRRQIYKDQKLKMNGLELFKQWSVIWD